MTGYITSYDSYSAQELASLPIFIQSRIQAAYVQARALGKLIAVPDHKYLTAAKRLLKCGTMNTPNPDVTYYQYKKVGAK